MRYITLAAILLFFAVDQSPAAGLSSRSYDPLSSLGDYETVELEVAYEVGDRVLPVRVYVPDSAGSFPVVLFSHGLGGSRRGSPFLGKHWAARGYVAVFVQHPGSDESVWKDVSMLKRRSTLKKAADAENFMHRVRDIPQVINALERWNAQAGHPLYKKLRLDRIGMSRHSFGAVTTQAVGGQKMPGRAVVNDRRITAAIAFSPSPPRRGDPVQAFGSVAIPWMLMTGTEDKSAIGGLAPEDRLNVYPHLPAGDKYELVLDGAEHSAFTERALPGENSQRNPNHHRAILALSTAFWDAYLKRDSAAAGWLNGDGPSTVLEPGDGWRHK